MGARRWSSELWPGPLTIVCRQQPSLQWDLGETRGTVAVRMPDHEVALELLARTGPLAVSSGQHAPGCPAATDADEAEEMLGGAVAVILDGGPDAGRGRLDDRRLHRPSRAGCCGWERRLPRRGWNDGSSTRSARPITDEGEPATARTVREYLLVFLVAAAVTYLLCVFARELALRSGAVAGCATATCTRSRSRTSAASRCSAGSAAAYLVAHAPAVPLLATPRSSTTPAWC